MASTSAFGWETPDDTDLVKDGAAAIRTLGNSIDTSMAELKGGTTGQVLSKTSNTDMDFTWTGLGGGMTLISTTTLSGSSVTISSIPATYNDLTLVITGFTPPVNHYQAIDFYTGSSSSVGGYDLYQIDTIGTTITTGSGKYYTSRTSAPGWSATNATSHSAITIYDYARTGVKHIIESLTAYTDGNGTRQVSKNFAGSANTGAINAINISTGLGGSFTGTAYLYGVK